MIKTITQNTSNIYKNVYIKYITENTAYKYGYYENR